MARSYNELKGYLDHYLGLLASSDGEVNENPIDKVSLLNAFFAGLQRSLLYQSWTQGLLRFSLRSERCPDWNTEGK